MIDIEEVNNVPADANRIGDLRRKRNLSQGELAELLFIDRSTLCKYENGTRDIPSAVLITIADFFQVSTDYLLRHNSYSDDSIDEMAISIKQMVDTLDREQLYEIRGYINAITKNKTAI